MQYPYSALNWLSIFSPRNASNATFVLNPASNRFRIQISFGRTLFSPSFTKHGPKVVKYLPAPFGL